MLRPHILLKLVHRLNLLEIRNFLLVGGQTSKDLGQLLRGNLFPELELTNENTYKFTGEKTSLQEYHQLLQTELNIRTNCLKITPEDIVEISVLRDIVEISVLQSLQVVNIFPVFKVTFKKEIINFLILLIEKLKTRDDFSKTYYSGIDIYFDFQTHYRLEQIAENKFPWYNVGRNDFNIYFDGYGIGGANWGGW